MKYPLQLRFKYFALAPQIYVTDGDGNEVLYVHQKLFRLKEKVNIFSNRTDKKLLFTIQADRIIDFSATYHVWDETGKPICSVKQYGWRSIWQTHFEILHGDTAKFVLREENPWVKVADTALGIVPFLEIFSGLIFHPSYAVSRVGGDGEKSDIIMRLRKKPSFVERFFEIEKLESIISEEEEKQVLAGILMMVLLERQRG